MNGLFALGEEYGWRGLMWEQLRRLGYLRANLILGPVWGLWHALLIVQGYNYGPHRLLGVDDGFHHRRLLRSDRAARARGERAAPAALHGMINGFAALLLLLAAGSSPLVAGPLGLLGAASFGVAGILFWRRSAGPMSPEPVPQTGHSR